ncbi:MAG: non-heme iron oxygenase ferredoxin subunit [Candidatus Dadabacteria bacterium]|nr:non-heme iron oxygenase ferredoxin subunit [Candidatus Dadabacteria bacterium]
MKKIADSSEIAPGEIKSFTVGFDEVAVCNVDGRMCAFIDRCTHQDLPLSDGDLSGGVVTCAYHGAQFNVETGEALCMPATEPLETVEVRVENGSVFIDL